MNRKLFKTAIASLLFAAVLLGGYSCSDDDYMSEYEVRMMIEQALRENNKNFNFTYWEIVQFNVKKSDWVWNNNTKRYEVVFSLPELTDFIYEDGIVLGFVFFGVQGVDEVQKTLPYVHTYYEVENGEIFPYTETISYDIQLKENGANKPTVAFYIQASDLIRVDNYLEDNNFRVVLLW